ncbi:hypothetical protein Tco_1352490 [Tanacetum coccineum]
MWCLCDPTPSDWCKTRCASHEIRSEDPNQHLNDFLNFHNHSAGGKLRDKSAKESWELIEDLALYDNKSWNDQRDIAKPVKTISLPQDVPSTSDRRLVELENQVQCLMEAHLAPKPSVYQAFVDCASSRTNKAGDNHVPGEWEIVRDAELNPFKDDLVFRKMVKFLEAILINIKENMWELEDDMYCEKEIRLDISHQKERRWCVAHIGFENFEYRWRENFERVYSNNFPTARKLSAKRNPLSPRGPPQSISSTWNISMMPRKMTLSLATRLVNREKRSLGGSLIFLFHAF